MDIEEVIRRIRAGQSDREIAAELEMGRNTVAKYRGVAAKNGWLEGPPPETAALAAAIRRDASKPHAAEVSAVEPYRERVKELVAEGVECAAIHARLSEQGFCGSYTAVRRFVRKMRKADPEVFVRVEVAPGSEAQVDFGFAGLVFDTVRKALRRAWVFVMVLSHSRHLYAELVWDQSIPTWLRLHANAFEFFGGVPATIVLDNLKAGIVKACWYEPSAQRSYRAFAMAYGFRIRACRPRTPRHKGKVEKGGVHYVKRNALAGRSPRSLVVGNEDLRRWILEIAGTRIHGTTKKRPLEVFEAREKSALQPLPAQALPFLEWAEATVHRDGHLVYGGSYYSAPFRLVGRVLWIRNTGRTLDVFNEWELVATHLLAHEPGTRRTLREHLPPWKTAWFDETPEWCRENATTIGPSAIALVEEWLASRPSDRLPAARGLLALRKKYTPERIEAACRRAIRFNEKNYRTVRKILEEGLDRREPARTAADAGVNSLAEPRFARPWYEFFGVAKGGDMPCPSSLN